MAASEEGLWEVIRWYVSVAILGVAVPAYLVKEFLVLSPMGVFFVDYVLARTTFMIDRRLIVDLCGTFNLRSCL